MIRYLIEKEFKQIFRDRFLPKMIFIMPCIMMLLLPWAANQEVNNVNLAVVDGDHSTYTRRLIDKIAASSYFNIVSQSATYDQAMDDIGEGAADIVLEIPRNMESDLLSVGVAQVLIATNAVNGMKGSIGANYLSAIVMDFSQSLLSEQGVAITAMPQSPMIRVVTVNRYNPLLNYKVFMVPAIIVILITLLCGFLPTLNIVSEKEKGTIEQINVTPVGKFTFIVAKLVPYWIIGYIALTLTFIIAYLVYGIIPEGSLLTIYLVAALYILSMSGFGLVISNYSDTMQQAMFVIFFFMLIFNLMSGLFTPISSMPDWAQAITMLNPLKYFIQVMRAVYLKGSGFMELYIPIGAIFLFALFSNLWAVWSYKKTN